MFGCIENGTVMEDIEILNLDIIHCFNSRNFIKFPSLISLPFSSYILAFNILDFEGGFSIFDKKLIKINKINKKGRKKIKID